MKKLVVYLDTQDFANLSKENIDPELKYVRDFLIEETSSSRTKIGYSFPLIFELIRNADEKHKEDRLRKARFIKLLCGNQAHPHPADLKSGRTFPNDGMWAPANSLIEISPEWLKSNLRSRMLERTNEVEGLSRKQRRQLKSTRGSIDVFRAINIGPLTKDDFPGIPVPAKFLEDRILEKYLRGQISGNLVVSILKQWTIDPENLFEIWYEYSGLENPLEKLISGQFDIFSERIEKLRIANRELKNAKRDLRQAQRELRKFANANPWATSTLTKNMQKISNDDPFMDFEQIASSAFGPGRGEVFKRYFSSMIESDVPPKQSDLVDLLHFLYIKDVDLFRCDRGMAHHVGRDPSSFQHKIVASLTDLPQRISELQFSSI